MKKSKINIGIITAFVIIALFNQCQDVRVSREKKEADAIKIETVEVSLRYFNTSRKNRRYRFSRILH